MMEPLFKGKLECGPAQHSLFHFLFVHMRQSIIKMEDDINVTRAAGVIADAKRDHFSWAGIVKWDAGLS